MRANENVVLGKSRNDQRMIKAPLAIGKLNDVAKLDFSAFPCIGGIRADFAVSLDKLFASDQKAI